jgi:molybdenum cofactor cytidylyltransferase
MPMIPGVLLAAGRSTRMGRAKALLRIDVNGPTFVDLIVRALLEGGAADAIVVGRPDDDALRAELDRLRMPLRFVPNPDADRGQLTSVIAGLNAADRPGTAGVLVTLVDVPLVRATTVAALISAFHGSQASIVRAVHGGRHGHPVIFRRPVFDELRRADPDVGAKAVLRARAQEILDVDAGDPGVVIDVDLPEDYERIKSRS